MKLVSLLSQWVWLGLWLLVVLSAACTGQRKSSTALDASEQAIPEDFQLFITRTGCFGQCPVYELFVNAEGQVLYQGHNNVPNQGRFQKQLSQAQLQELVSAIEGADFFAFENSYDDGTTDLPTVITEVEMKNKRHKVINRTGPPALEKLQDRLDAIIDEEGYEPVAKE
jgi:hypothetical protein